MLKIVNKRLGPKQRILGADRKKMKYILEKLTGKEIEVIVKQSKPLKWRQFIIRAMCTTSGETGQELRKLWADIYRGDLRYGVRDARMKAKEKNWPRKESNAFLQKQDRNTWIAGSILKSFQSEVKIRGSSKSESV